MKFPNLPSDELAMLATVEAASNAEQFYIIPELPPTRDHRIRLAALHSLVAKGWILEAHPPGEHAFYTERAKVFKPTHLL
jgi:hypothetical protein